MQSGVAQQPSAALRRAAAWLLSPLAITDTGAQQVIEALQLRDGPPLQNAKRAHTRGTVAVIPVEGPLSKESSWFSSFFGSSDYATIGKDLQHALDSAEVTSIVLYVDSPGGEAFGAGELGKAIRAARSQKPITAYVSGMGCSAAYWLASACDEVICDASAWLGSIGVRSSLVDFSKMYEAIGIKVHEIVSEQSPHKVIDAGNEADRLRLQATLTDMAVDFIADVAAGRRVSTAKVKADFGKGDVLVGKSAVQAGLADRVGSFEALIADLSARSTTSPGATMPVKKPGATVGDAKCDGCDREMDDGDEMFCRACHAEADAKVSHELAALTGKSTLAEQKAVLEGWKQAAAEVSELRARVEKQEKAAADAEFIAALKEFEEAKIIPPGADHKRRKYAMGLRGQPGAAASLRAYCETLDPLVAVDEPTVPEAKRPAPPLAPVIPLGAMGDDEKKMAAALGRPLEELVQAVNDEAAGKKWNPNQPQKAGGAK